MKKFICSMLAAASILTLGMSVNAEAASPDKHNEVKMPGITVEAQDQNLQYTSKEGDIFRAIFGLPPKDRDYGRHPGWSHNPPPPPRPHYGPAPHRPVPHGGPHGPRR